VRGDDLLSKPSPFSQVLNEPKDQTLAMTAALKHFVNIFEWKKTELGGQFQELGCLDGRCIGEYRGDCEISWLIP
jgi:hypothetical protein